MQSLRRTLALSAACVPVVAMLAFIPAGSARAACAGASPDATPGCGWTYFPVGTTLSGAATITVVGTVGADGGCEYNVSNSGTGSVATEEIETGEDASTCTAQFTSGVPTTITADTAAPDGSTAETADTADSTSTAATAYSHSIYQDNKWLDPVGIQVNAQEQWFHWNTGSCVGAWSASWKWSWLSADGWGKRWGDKSVATSCAKVTNKADSAFQNSVFCVGFTTYTYFGWNGSGKVSDTLAGTSSGGWSWSYDDYKNGAVCNNLLHHGHVFTA